MKRRIPIFALHDYDPCILLSRLSHTRQTLTHTHDTGKAIAEVIRGEIKEDVEALKASKGVTPGLAVVLVGNRTDSATYVRMKIKACEEVGSSAHVGGSWWCFIPNALGDTPSSALFLFSCTATQQNQVGISSFKFEFGEDVTEEALIAKVKALNADPAIHG